MSSTLDLHAFESGDGGELTLINEDLVLSESLFQVIYISLFGGNIEASTRGNEIESEERFDFWANELIYKDRPHKQLNSETERVLRSVVLNSSGRLQVESAVNQDLLFLKNIVTLSVNVVILSTDKLKIVIGVNSIPNQSNKEFQFIWDNARNEIIIDKTI